MSIVTQNLHVGGMQCVGCETLVEEALLRLGGVRRAQADYARESVAITFDDRKVQPGQIVDAIKHAGYACSPVRRQAHPWLRTLFSLMLGLGGITLILVGAQWVEQLRLPNLDRQLSYSLLFLVGLLTGFHCVGMCGGFVLGYTANNAALGRHSFAFAHAMYGLGKTLSYTLIGALFGWLGSIIAFTPQLRGGVGIVAGGFLVLMGLGMLRVFPSLHIGMRLPGFLRRFIQRESRRHRSPFAIGLLNGLMIACGPLQAMYVMAAGTGSALEGALRLFVFGAGTLPVLLGFGVMASLVSHRSTERILKVSAIFVVVIGWVMVNRGLVLTGAGYDIKTATAVVFNTLDHWIERLDRQSGVEDGQQVIRMVVTRSGYHPDSFVLRQGVPVKWVIEGRELTYCNRRITVPSLNLEFDLAAGEQTIEFVPQQSGVIPWSCWMGMIPGSFIVEPSEVAPPSGAPEVDMDR